MRVAAIDIGSNSIRLLVAEASGGVGLVAVARAGEPCRLARGLHRSGRVDEQIAERAAGVTAEFARRAAALGAVRIVVGATAALRAAENGQEVAARIEARCGLRVRILSGDDEAQLVYGAVVAGLGAAARSRQCVVFDLGGGSTEIVSGVADQPGRWASLALGAVSITERFLASNPPSTEELTTAREHIVQKVMHKCAYMPTTTPLLAGVGGTVTALASLDRGLSSYVPALLEGWMIPNERLGLLLDRVLASTHEERRTWPVLGEGRADIVVAGALIVGVLVEQFRAPGLVCSTQGLRYGLARLAAEEAAER